MSKEQETQSEPEEEVIAEVIVIEVWGSIKKAIADAKEDDSNSQNRYPST